MSRLKWMVALAGAAAVATATVAPTAFASRTTPSTPMKPVAAVQGDSHQAKPQPKSDPCKYVVTQGIKEANRHRKVKVVTLKITRCRDKQQKVGLYLSKDGRHGWKLLDVAKTDRHGEHTFIRPKNEHGTYVVRAQAVHRPTPQPLGVKRDQPAPRTDPGQQTPPPPTCKPGETLITDPASKAQSCKTLPAPPTCKPGESPVNDAVTKAPSCTTPPAQPAPHLCKPGKSPVNDAVTKLPSCEIKKAPSGV